MSSKDLAVLRSRKPGILDEPPPPPKHTFNEGVPPLIEMRLSKSSEESGLNKTEVAYLEYLRNQGHPWIGVQIVTFKLGHDCRFTPDFVYVSKECRHMTAIDVKGFQRDDALVKIKTAARLFPWAEFYIVKKTKNGWDHILVKP